MLEEVEILRSKWLSNPDDFWNYDIASGFVSSANAIAQNLFGHEANGRDVAVVDNLTTAVAIVVDSVITNISEPDCVILTSNMTYNAVRLAIEHGCSIANKRTTGLNISIVAVEVPFPLCSNCGDSSTVTEAILTAYRTALNRIKLAGKKIAFVFLDHITSVPSILMPVKELVALCREHSAAEILVDGAHAPGQLDLSESGLLRRDGQQGCDYYVANMHKWCFAPPTCAFLWVSPQAPSRHLLHHPVVSHRYGEVCQPATPTGSMVAAGSAGGVTAPIFSECAMLGTRDYAPMLSVSACFRFTDSLGGLAAIRERNGALCVEAAKLLAQMWGTEQCTQHSALQTCSLAMVGCSPLFGSSWQDSERLRLGLREQHRIIIQKPYPVPGDRLYVRLSVAVYNSIDEFEVLGHAVLYMLKELQNMT